ncbi:hypothetical protein M4914_12655 [Streptomyces somaliensis DSM 40738]|uniref:Uncharacterized protein n=1 Tax=Streptomyces somaliensis (strain ATCC 33201 / DSM 40738 / JCM 12659 / KCTC 9044 / NCTC 11332 / NRRL B-12077 / IP 733) TaxID=1134445 RepID=A0AA44DGG5_STRE0|nr:hypothetical protein [Streptomyces somaliensis]MCQ0023717.1 hypothetical protein [Streptomyces somaliensis DSM 40738]NKY15671.1 hypothetical protein [Streptomyces somaliensis DSM 40738]
MTKPAPVALRRAAVSAAAGALGLGLAAPLALAAPEAPARGGTAARFGGTVVYDAAPGVENDVAVGVFLGELAVQDETGAAAGPGCVRRNDVLVTCGPAAGVTRITLRTGDLDDRVHVAVPLDAVVDPGAGADQVTTHGGGDRITLGDGESGDRVASCGAGADAVAADPGDTVPASCENRLSPAT